MGYLDYAGRTGEQQLGAVRGAREALGRRARRDDRLRTAMSDFVAATQRVPDLVSGVQSSQSRVVAAAARVKEVIAQGQARAAEREAASAQSRVESIQADIARAKGIAGNVIGIAADLVQQNWVAAGVNLGKFVGAELVGAAIEAAYSDELQRARADLEEARQQLQGFQNEQQAQALIGAAHTLRSEQQALRAARQRLVAQAQLADRAETHLTNVLDSMGVSDATAALHARSSVMETSDRVLRLLASYQARVSSVSDSAERLLGTYERIASAVLSAGGERSIPDESTRSAIFARADHNRVTLESVQEWATNEPAHIERVRAVVQTGGFLTSYDQMINDLHTALST